MNARHLDQSWLGFSWRRVTRLRMAGPLVIATALAMCLATACSAAHPAGQAQSAKWSGHRAAGSAQHGDSARRWGHSGYGSTWSRGSHGRARSAWGLSTVFNGTTGNLDGFSVAISGKTAVIAAPGTKSNAGSSHVYNYIFRRSGSQWAKVATLPDPRGLANDEYAWSVAISSSKAGTYVAIGGNNTNGQPDLVYIYKGSGKTWSLEATLRDPGNSYEDMFGDALAISSTTLVVGASCVDYNSGAAYIYERSGSHWLREASMRDPLDRENDTFGGSVAVSGDTVLIGSNGQGYVYTHKPGHGWPQTAVIRNPGPPANFGLTVTLSGKTAVIGAPGPAPNTPDPGSLSAGTAYLYTLKGTAWSRRQKLTAPAGIHGDEFGYAVAMTSSRLLIGMPTYGKIDCGNALVFTPSGGKWDFHGQVKDPACTAGDQFGYAVALYEATGVIGAPGTNSGQGANYELPLP
jgi:hypothetical protein